MKIVWFFAFMLCLLTPPAKGQLDDFAPPPPPPLDEPPPMGVEMEPPPMPFPEGSPPLDQFEPPVPPMPMGDSGWQGGDAYNGGGYGSPAPSPHIGLGQDPSDALKFKESGDKLSDPNDRLHEMEKELHFLKKMYQKKFR